METEKEINEKDYVVPNYLVHKASSTQIYRLLFKLRGEIVKIYRNYNKCNRLLVVNPVYELVNEMIGDYSFAYLTKDRSKRIERLEKVLTNYFIVESSIVEFYDEHMITIGRVADLTETIFNPLYNNIDKYLKYNLKNTVDE